MPEFLQTGLRLTLMNQLRDVFKSCSSIEKVVLYGSRTKGTYRAGSDIDVSLFGNITYTECLSIETKIDDLLSPYLFDVSIFSEIESDELINHIERLGIEIYTRI
jgi:predicted nucleotidyltransferase